MMNNYPKRVNEPGELARPIPDGHRVEPAAIARDEKIWMARVANLNQLLADTLALRDLYKKHHSQGSGPSFYQLHLLFDTIPMHRQPSRMPFPNASRPSAECPLLLRTMLRRPP